LGNQVAIGGSNIITHTNKKIVMNQGITPRHISQGFTRAILATTYTAVPVGGVKTESVIKRLITTTRR
jgi:uncharacterized protein YcsI (UPF0317 family)